MNYLLFYYIGGDQIYSGNRWKAISKQVLKTIITNNPHLTYIK